MVPSICLSTKIFLCSVSYIYRYNSSRIIYRATVPVAEKIRTKGSKNVHTLPNNPTACYIAMDSICFAYYSSTKKISIVLFNSMLRTIFSSFLSTYFNFLHKQCFPRNNFLFEISICHSILNWLVLFQVIPVLPI